MKEVNGRTAQTYSSLFWGYWRGYFAFSDAGRL